MGIQSNSACRIRTSGAFRVKMWGCGAVLFADHASPLQSRESRMLSCCNSPSDPPRSCLNQNASHGNCFRNSNERQLARILLEEGLAFFIVEVFILLILILFVGQFD